MIIFLTLQENGSLSKTCAMICNEILSTFTYIKFTDNNVKLIIRKFREVKSHCDSNSIHKIIKYIYNITGTAFQDIENKSNT